MDFTIPEEIQQFIAELDAFIEREIKPLEAENIQFFDYRREWARTDFEHGGVPRQEWEDLLGEMRRRADAAGFFRYALPAELGGRDGTNLGMAVIREHLAHMGLGLHNDLQNEASVVGNFPTVLMLHLTPLAAGVRVTLLKGRGADHGTIELTWPEGVPGYPRG